MDGKGCSPSMNELGLVPQFFDVKNTRFFVSKMNRESDLDLMLKK